MSIHNYLLGVMFISCTNAKQIQNKKFLLMDSLWKTKSYKAQVIKTLGSSYEEVSKGVVYKIPGRQFIESGHFFNSSGQLSEQFIFVDKGTFEEFRESFPCNWIETSDMKGSKHSVQKIPAGSCEAKNIQYEFTPAKNSYELRWKSIEGKEGPF